MAAGIISDSMFVLEEFLQRTFDAFLILAIMLSSKGWGILRTAVPHHDLINSCGTPTSLRAAGAHVTHPAPDARRCDARHVRLPPVVTILLIAAFVMYDLWTHYILVRQGPTVSPSSCCRRAEGRTAQCADARLRRSLHHGFDHADLFGGDGHRGDALHVHRRHVAAPRD